MNVRIAGYLVPDITERGLIYPLILFNCHSDIDSPEMEFLFQPDNTDVHLDVSDMVRVGIRGGIFEAVCISFQSVLSQRISSIIYRCDGSNSASMIVEPSNAFALARDGIISYANVYEDIKVRGRVSVNNVTSELTFIKIVPDTKAFSTIPRESFRALRDQMVDNMGMELIQAQ